MEEKKGCGNCSEQEKCIPFFDHQNTMMHYNWANRRMLIALVCVCLTFIITIMVFVTGYTAREKNWLDTIQDIRTPAAEVNNGQQNADP